MQGQTEARNRRPISKSFPVFAADESEVWLCRFSSCSIAAQLHMGSLPSLPSSSHVILRMCQMEILPNMKHGPPGVPQNHRTAL